MESDLTKQKELELDGWLQQCKKCGHLSKYELYITDCEACGEGNLDVFFKCHQCNSITDFGHTRCSGCRKKISDIICAPYLKTMEKKIKRIPASKLLKLLFSFVIFGVLLYLATGNFFIALPIAIILALLCILV